MRAPLAKLKIVYGNTCRIGLGLGISILITILGNFDMGGSWIPLWEASQCFLSYIDVVVYIYGLFMLMLLGKAGQRDFQC